MKKMTKNAALRMGVVLAALSTASTLPAAAATPQRPAQGQTRQRTVFNTASTQFVAVQGVQLAYRRYGKKGGVPLVFFQHFVGNLDSWDPRIVDGFARGRDVVIFDNAGVGGSAGEVPPHVEGMAQYGVGLMAALGIAKADLLGFSMGSLVAQQIALERPDLVRSLILVGSGPRGGAGMASITPEFVSFLGKKRDVPDELLLDVFFTPSPASQAAGREFLTRIRARTVNRDPEVNDKVAPAQVAAFAAWGAPRADANAYLKAIQQPVLVVSGSHDIVHYTVNSFTLQQNLPNAQLIIYPDSNHGSFYQYPEQFLKQATMFLDAAK